MGCRDIQKAETVRNEVTQITGSSNVVCKSLDLASQQSIREFAADFNQSKAFILSDEYATSQFRVYMHQNVILNQKTLMTIWFL